MVRDLQFNPKTCDICDSDTNDYEMAWKICKECYGNFEREIKPKLLKVNFGWVFFSKLKNGMIILDPFNAEIAKIISISHSKPGPLLRMELWNYQSLIKKAIQINNYLYIKSPFIEKIVVDILNVENREISIYSSDEGMFYLLPLEPYIDLFREIDPINEEITGELWKYKDQLFLRRICEEN